MAQSGFQLGQKLKERWQLLLFGTPFAAVGIGILLLGMIAPVAEWVAMKSWEPVAGELTRVELKSQLSDGTITYKVQAGYRYDYGGGTYQGTRVALASGADNIGDFQKQLYRQLKARHDRGQSVTVYVNPQSPAEALLNRELRGELLGFKLVFVIVFGGIGLGLWAYALFAAPDKVANLSPAQRQSQPWLERRAWSRVVKSNGKSMVYVAWGFTVFWNAIAIPAAIGAVSQALEGKTAAYLALIFPAVGMALLAWAIKATLGWRRFGPAPLTLDPYPGAIGGQVGGTIDVNLPYRPDQVFEVTLQCLRCYYTGTGKDRKRSESLVWQRQGFAHAQRSAQGTRLSVLFDVEPDLPPSQVPDSDYHLWRLEVSCELPGADFDRRYEIPVFATGERATELRELSGDHPQAQQSREQSLEQVLDIRQIPGGVIVHYPAFRQVGSKAALLLVGSVFAAFGWFIPSDDFPTWIFTLIGVAALLAGAYLLCRSLDVRLDQQALITRTRLFGLSLGNRRTPRNDITSLAIKESYSSQNGKRHTTYYKLQALHRDGKKTTIGFNLAGRDVAEQALESLSVLTGVPTQ